MIVLVNEYNSFTSSQVKLKLVVELSDGKFDTRADKALKVYCKLIRGFSSQLDITSA